MRLLSLDIATRVGWAFGDTEAGDPVSGVFNIGQHDDTQKYALAYGKWLVGMLTEYRPEMVYMEAPMKAAGVINAHTDYKLKGLCFATELVTGGRNVACCEVDAGTWKKSFCGKAGFGKATKPYPPIIACRERGWQVKDDNQADALGIWCHGAGLISPKYAVRFDPLFRGTSKPMEVAHA